MRNKDLMGRLRYLNSEKCRINWDGKSLSKFQRGIKQFLKKYWQGHIVYEECPMVGTRLRLDIYNATKKIAIECNGNQHREYNEFFHGGNQINYLAQLRRDGKKYEWCEINGITLIDIFPEDLPLSKSFFSELNISL